MKKISFELKDLIKKMLVPAKNRITIDKIFQHPWVKAAELNKANIRLNYGKIINFSKYSKLKTFAVSYLASQMPSKEISKLGVMFKEIDLNHDGYISTE